MTGRTAGTTLCGRRCCCPALISSSLVCVCWSGMMDEVSSPPPLRERLKPKQDVPMSTAPVIPGSLVSFKKNQKKYARCIHFLSPCFAKSMFCFADCNFFCCWPLPIPAVGIVFFCCRFPGIGFFAVFFSDNQGCMLQVGFSVRPPPRAILLRCFQ